MEESKLLNNETLSWYVLNHVASAGGARESAAKVVERFNRLRSAELQLFAPTYVVREERDGQARLRTARLAFHYVFVRGTFAAVKALCGEANGFSFLINRAGDERYATVSDAEMQSFRAIARTYENCLPYFNLADIDLEEGDLVEVVNGDFPGLVGTYIPRAKSKSGNIVLRVCQNLGTVAYNIKAADVRVLRFSTHSTRANDQIDAFVPHLLKALRYYRADEPLPAALATRLTVFTRRMEAVTLPSTKLNAKIALLLFASKTILGENRLINNSQFFKKSRNNEVGKTDLSSSALFYKEKFDSLRKHITNPFTLALEALILMSFDKNLLKYNQNYPNPSNFNFPKYIFEILESEMSKTPKSKMQKLILEEIQNYIDTEISY